MQEVGRLEGASSEQQDMMIENEKRESTYVNVNMEEDKVSISMALVAKMVERPGNRE